MKCFYHSSDLDGHCSGAIVKLKYPDCEMIPINYYEDFPFETIKQYEEVFMVDFCLSSLDDLLKLREMCSKFHLIDHHETHINKILESGIKFDGSLVVGYAGCELTWMYLHNYEPPDPVTLLGRYDVWDHQDERVLPFQYGMRQFEDTRPDQIIFWSRILNQEDFVKEIIRQGRTILEYQDKQNTKFCRTYAFEALLGEHKAICANIGFTNSKVFDSVYNPKLHDIMLTFVYSPKKRLWLFSIYTTREGINCGKIAEYYGGGGHKNAAGFALTNIPFRL